MPQTQIKNAPKITAPAYLIMIRSQSPVKKVTTQQVRTRETGLKAGRNIRTSPNECHGAFQTRYWVRKLVTS